MRKKQQLTLLSPRFLSFFPYRKPKKKTGIDRGGPPRPPAAHAALAHRRRPPPARLLPRLRGEGQPCPLRLARARGDAGRRGLCPLGLDDRGQVGVPGAAAGEAAEASASAGDFELELAAPAAADKRRRRRQRREGSKGRQRRRSPLRLLQLLLRGGCEGELWRRSSRGRRQAGVIGWLGTERVVGKETRVVKKK